LADTNRSIGGPEIADIFSCDAELSQHWRRTVAAARRTGGTANRAPRPWRIILRLAGCNIGFPTPPACAYAAPRDESPAPFCPAMRGLRRPAPAKVTLAHQAEPGKCQLFNGLELRSRKLKRSLSVKFARAGTGRWRRLLVLDPLFLP